MWLEIDTSHTGESFDQTTQIEGVEYLWRFAWSSRESAMYVGLYDQNEDPIAIGIKLVTATYKGNPIKRKACQNLLRRFSDPRLPPGALLLVDMSGTAQEMSSAADLGAGRWRLVYITSDDPELG